MPSNLIYPAVLRGFGRIRLTPMRRTVITEYEGGQEQRQARWLTPKFRIELDYEPFLEEPTGGVMTTPDWKTLMDFWHDREAMLESFLFEDWTLKTQLRTNEFLGKGNGSRTVFKVYEDSLASAVIYKNGVVQTQPGQVTVDTATGKVTFVAAPALNDIIRADVTNGYFRVRFDMDEPEMERIRGVGWRIRVAMLQTRENL